MCKIVFEGKMDELRRLLRAKADANVTDYDKQSPLHIAAAEGNLPAVSAAALGSGEEGGLCGFGSALAVSRTVQSAGCRRRRCLRHFCGRPPPPPPPPD